MTCDYCFYTDEIQKRTQALFGFMTEDTLKNVIRKTMLRAQGSITYAYQGGEPTLRGLEFYKKAIAYQKQYNKNGIKVFNALQTNGYAINEEWCEFFHENNFLIGVSVDGTKDIHDAYRHNKSGDATYETVLRATQLMDRYNVEYNILTVVNQKVATNCQTIYEEYKKRGWNYQQYIACLDPLNEPQGQNEYALTPQQYGQFLIKLFKLWYADLKNGSQPYIRQFENYIGMFLGRLPEACDHRGICSVQYVVEADGSVFPCDFYMLDDYRIGNFNDNQLDEVDTNREKIGFINRSMLIEDECKECRFYRICRGGCQRNRDLDEQTGRYINYFCESYKMFFEVCYEDMKSIANLVK